MLLLGAVQAACVTWWHSNTQNFSTSLLPLVLPVPPAVSLSFRFVGLVVLCFVMLAVLHTGLAVSSCFVGLVVLCFVMLAVLHIGIAVSGLQWCTAAWVCFYARLMLPLT